jgi:hypothetical protein
MTFQLIQHVDDIFIVSEFDESNILPSMSARGFELLGVETSPRLRPELQGQPKFDGALGPMWGGTKDDGTPIIRYEDKDSYRVLSDDTFSA